MRPALPRPDDAAYRYALDVVRYEGGDLDSAPASVAETIRGWRDWQRYDAALPGRAGRDEASRAADAASADVLSGEVSSARAVRRSDLDPDWALIIDDLFPYLYAHWQPVEVPQAGHPRRGTPHVANADGSRLSTHLALWMAQRAGLIRYVTHRPADSTARAWSQWVPLDPANYARQLAEVLPALQRARGGPRSMPGSPPGRCLAVRPRASWGSASRLSIGSSARPRRPLRNGVAVSGHHPRSRRPSRTGSGTPGGFRGSTQRWLPA